MNLGAVLLQAAANTPDPVAIVSPERETFGSLALSAGRLAARLATEIHPGDRVVLLAGNDLAFVRSYLAILTAGGVAVPVSVASPSLEVERELSVVSPKLVITSPTFADLAAPRLRAVGVAVASSSTSPYRGSRGPLHRSMRAGR